MPTAAAPGLPTAKKRRTTADTDTLLEEIRDRYRVATDFWKEARDEAQTDMRFVAGDPWPAEDRDIRKKHGRPCLSLDELGQYFNQVINDVRANARAVKFSPVGNGANDKTSQLYQDKMREIEYRSHAQIAYTTAFQNAVHRSYGWLRLRTDYLSPRSFDQEICIDAIPNPDMVVADPESQRPDSADMRYLFHFERWTEKEFQRRFPKAEITSFSDYRTAEFGQWVGDRTITIAEYWRIEDTERELLLVQDPATGETASGFADQYNPALGGVVLQRRAVQDPSVRMYLTNGLEILDESDWAGRFIPFVSCYGPVLYVDDGTGAKRKLMSMTRLARDPYMAYCFYRTSEIENVGMTTKNPYWAYEGQLSPTQLIEVQKSIHQPVAVLLAKATTDGTGQQILPLPQRNVSEAAIQALSVGAEEMRRAIQAAMGSSPLPTQAQRRNEKSGVALQQIEETSQRGTYHFIDHYDDLIRQVGVLVEDLMDKVYDTKREIGVRDENEQAHAQPINDPTNPEAVPTQGDHLVTVSTGPSFESEREAGIAFADAIVKNLEMIAAVAGPQAAKAILAKSIQLQNIGTVGDQIAKIIDPPPMQNPDGTPPSPQQLEQALQQATGQMQQMQQQMQEMGKAIETDQIKSQAELAKEQMRQEAETTREAAKLQLQAKSDALDNLVKLAIAEIGAQSALSQQHGEMAREALGYEHQHAEGEAARGAQAAEKGADRADKAAERDAKAREGAAGRTSEADEGDRGRAHEAAQAERDRQVAAQTQAQEQAFAADQAERERAAAQEAEEGGGA